MSKHLFSKPFLFILLYMLTASTSRSQCTGGYTSAQLNWDNIDYYWNSGLNVAPYGYRVSGTNYTYVSDAMEQTQKFAIGTSSVTIATSNAAMVNPGAGNSAENATHTGNLAGYLGEDVQYVITAIGQTITFTFPTPVQGPNFTLYDIDGLASFQVSATNNLAAATAVTTSNLGGSLTSVGATSKTITSTTVTNLANNLNTGSVTITVAGLVSSITIQALVVGGDPTFWLSDINACVLNAFPTNWHQTASFQNRPFWGPTQTQPDYFLVTPDNNYAYYVDPATGIARALFQDPAKVYVNSFAYDPANRFLYYITENSSTNYLNKELKRYNYNTETYSVLIPDITAAPFNIPTFNIGVESAGCAFYNGSLYFGIEGGVYGTSNPYTTRETIIYRIDFDVSNNPTGAVQVFAMNAGTSGASTSLVHDWGDFIIKDGVIYDYNTAVNGGSYAASRYHHYDMMTGNITISYNNPGTTIWNGQAGMGWSGNLYYFRAHGVTAGASVVGSYNGTGTNGAPTTITVAAGSPAWPGNSGDASDPFKPKCDFGDAPASYDPYVTPATQSPAVHERSEGIRLGATWDYEFLKRGVTGNNDVDDGNSYNNFLPPGTGNFLAYTYATNTSATAATIYAWLDYNGNGTFDVSEAIGPISVPAGTNNQLYWLFWPSTPNGFSAGGATYMRIRISSTSAGMTSAHATGYFTNGEVEDYRIQVDNYPLAVNNLSFNVELQNNSFAKLNWSGNEDGKFTGYEIQRSRDAVNWEYVGIVGSNGQSGQKQYEYTDPTPYKGTTFYRLQLIGMSGNNKYSEVKSVRRLGLDDMITVMPNPVKTVATINIKSDKRTTADIALINAEGKQVYDQKITINAGTNSTQLPVKTEWPAGTYILRIGIDDETTNKKLIIYR